MKSIKIMENKNLKQIILDNQDITNYFDFDRKRKIISFTVCNLKHVQLHGVGGWGNGYVGVSYGHPLYNEDYLNIDVDVHGGLTFGKIVSRENIFKMADIFCNDISSEYKVFGFDTSHLGDYLDDCFIQYMDIPNEPLIWTRRDVIYETIKLYNSFKNCEFRIRKHLDIH